VIGLQGFSFFTQMASRVSIYISSMIVADIIVLQSKIVITLDFCYEIEEIISILTYIGLRN